LDVHTGMSKLPLIITYALPTYHSSWVSSPPTQSCLGCDIIFWFTPCTPHHNHHNCLHPTMGTHLLCLESITHHNFQFGPKCFKCLLPSMVQISPSFSTNSLKFWPIMKKIPTILPPLWSILPSLFVDKGHQTIVISLWPHLKFCIQTIPKTFQNFEVQCIMGNCLIQLETYILWPIYTFPSMFFIYSQKHHRSMGVVTITCTIASVTFAWFFHVLKL